MSMIRCDYCDDFSDTDDGEGMWDVQKICGTKIYPFVCGICTEKYINEAGDLDPDLEEKTLMIDRGDAMAAIAEDTQNG